HDLSATRARDKVDAPEMPLQRGHLPAGRNIPEAHRIIEASRCERYPVGRERAKPDPGGMAFERLQLLAGLHFEKLHVLTGTSGRQKLAIRGECYRVDWPGI